VDFQLADVSRIALGALLVGLLLRGSRIAWTLILAGTVYQIGSSIDGSHWHLIAGVLIALCLLAPTSVRYVWRAQAQKTHRETGQRLLGAYAWIRAAAYTGAHRLIGWDDGESEQESRQRRYYAGLWRFGIACLVLLLLGGVVVNWQEGAGGDSSILNVVESVMWVCYVVAQVAFMVLLVLAMRGVVARRKVHGR
jgi:hypothetical protein